MCVLFPHIPANRNNVYDVFENVVVALRTRNLARVDHGWVRADLHKALQVWSKHSKLTFREVNSESADILVYFEKGYHGDGYPFDGPGQILAHAFFPGSGRGGDAHFDEDEEWLLNGKETADGTSLFTVAAHEFGHSLGLSHSSVQGALMFPWYQGLKPDFELPDDDRFAIQILYGPKNDKIWANIPTGYRPTSTQRPELSDTWTTETTTTTTPRTRTRSTAVDTTTTTTTRRPPPPPPRRRDEETPPPPPRRRDEETPPRRKDERTPPPRRKDERVPVVVADGKPDFCNTSFDAVSIIRKDTFFFKGKYTWRLGTKGLYAGYPALISRLWYNLPDDLSRVDAVYERQDGKIVFFIGRNYYVFNGNVPDPGYPKPLSALGLPDDLDHVDAATVWGHNSKTYIFSGTAYWRYDDETGRMELDYPRDMSIWRGVGYNIDAAFQWHDGATYFLRNQDYWKFNDLRMRVEHQAPRSIGQFWMNCSVDDGRRWPTVGVRVQTAGKDAGRGGRMWNVDDDDNDNDASAAIGRDHPYSSWTWPLAATAVAVFLRRPM